MTIEPSSEEQFILSESPEIQSGEDLTWLRRLLHAFPAFENRNFRLYFTGQTLSLVGTWLQIVAQGWLVFDITHSAAWVGAVAAASMVPSLLLTLWGGVIVDRFPKKKILLFTQASSMVLALILGIVVVAHVVTVLQIIILSFLLGMVTAIDAPARQAFVAELVGKNRLASAIALNSGAFNATRVIGPGIAGFLIALVGAGGAFLLNAASYIAVLIALVAIKPHPHKAPPPEQIWHAIREGIKYAYAHPIIRTMLGFVAMTSIFGWSYSSMMPVIARNVFHVDAAGLGQLYAATGLGAVTATILISLFSNRVRPFVFILCGNTLFGVAMTLFSFTTTFEWGLVWLFFSGLGLLSQMAMANTLIQSMVSDRMRGRVMSLFILMFLGFSPIGSIQVGYMTEHFGPGVALRFNAIMLMLVGAVIAVNRRKIRIAHKAYVDLSEH